MDTPAAVKKFNAMKWLKWLLIAWVLLAIITFVASMLGANASWVTNPIGSLKAKFFPPKTTPAV